MVKKIDFLNRLFVLSACLDELVEFLKSEKLISDHQIGAIRTESDKSKYIYNLLETLKTTDKLLLLDYEWSILPLERLKLTIVTERSARDFKYNC